VRNLILRDYGFVKADAAKNELSKFGIQCIYSDEEVTKPDRVCDTGDSAITGLNCAGYGSSVCVTAPFGFAAAGLLLQQLLHR